MQCMFNTSSEIKFMECSYSYLVLSLFLLVCIRGLISRLTKKRKLPPGPTGLPFIGSLLTIGDRPHESLAKLAKMHGPLMTVQLGFNTIVVASSADMAREILQKNDQAFLGRPIPHAILGGTGNDLSLAWLQGSSREWKTLRKLSNSHIFTTKRLDALQDLRHQMMDGMVQRVVGASEAGEAIHIGRLVFATTLNLLSNTMFSDDMLDPKSDAILELKDLVGRILVLAAKPNLADYFPFLKPLDLGQIARYSKVSYDRLHELMEGMVSRRLNRRESGSSRTGDFLDILLDHYEEHGVDQLTLREIKALLTDLFIGGTDTTSTTLEWAMTELLRNPTIMAKAKQELSETIGFDQTIKEKDIPQLPYLQSLLKETMRLHPTAPFLVPHLTETDAQICGYTIPKDTQVLVNSWAMSQDPAYWDNPNHFVPERFLDSQMDFRGTNLSFIPFGSGRRICPGLTLAVRMLSLLLGSLLHHFDWKLPDGMAPQDLDMKEKFGLTLQKAIPLVAIPQITALS